MIEIHRLPLKFIYKLIRDFFQVFKVRLIKIFAILGAILSSNSILGNTFIKRYIERTDFNSLTGLTQKELALLIIPIIAIYVIDRYLNVISNSQCTTVKLEENKNKKPKKPVSENISFRYSTKSRKSARTARITSWLLFLILFIYMLFTFTQNNDYCQNALSEMGIKIFQFSDSYEHGASEDGITTYVHNRVRQALRDERVDVDKLLTRIDVGSKEVVLDKYLSCYGRGILTYGYRNPGDSTFICNIYLKNMINPQNKIKTSKGVIVLDDPKFIAFKESYKGRYISNFLLGIYYYYNKEYEKAIKNLSDISKDSICNQVASLSNLYIGYSKLMLDDVNGLESIKRAQELDPGNEYANRIISKEDLVYEKKIQTKTTDTVIIHKKFNALKLTNWPRAVVSLSFMNQLYIGLPNRCDILVNGILGENIKVTLDKGIVNGADGLYNLQVNIMGTDTLRIFERTPKNELKEIFKKGFRVVRIQDPKAKFGGQAGGIVSTINLKSQDGLYVEVGNLHFEGAFIVKSFTMIISIPGEEPIAYNASGNKLSAQMKDALKKLVPGSTLLFNNITALGPDGAIRGLDGIMFKAN
jgi:hypothetical protein